jgi:hypothetical protein
MMAFVHISEMKIGRKAQENMPVDRAELDEPTPTLIYDCGSSYRVE